MKLGGERDSEMEKKKGKGRRNDVNEERERSRKKRRQLGEEDEVRPEGRIPRPESCPTTISQSNTRRLPRPSRLSPNP